MSSDKMRGGIVNRPRKDGAAAYYAPVRYKDETGKVKQKWLGPFAQRSEADKARTAFKANLLKGQRPQPRAYTVDKLLDDWLATSAQRLAASSLAAYKRRADKHIRPRLGSRPVSELEPLDVERFVTHLWKSGLGQAQQSLVFQALSSALRYAVKMQKIATAPTAFVGRPSYQPPKRPALSEEDAARIIEASRGARLGLAIELILYTGLRRQESLHLRWRDIDLENATLMVGKSKTAAGVRLFPLPSVMVDALKAHKPEQATRDDYVFIRSRDAGRRSRPGMPLALDALDKAWWTIRTAAGYPELHLHDLRHGFATIAIRNGVDLVHVAELLGHKDASITAKVYAHVTAEGRRAAADKVAEALRRGQESRIARKLLDGVLDGQPETSTISPVSDSI